MDNTKKTNRTVAEEVSEAQKYWKKNYLWTALLFVSLTGIIGTAFAFRKKLRK